MLYSPEKKRKIILDNFNNPSKQLVLTELEKRSIEWRMPFFTFRSLDNGCGDILHLLVIKKDGYIEKCFFSGQQSCLITIAAANMICSCLEKKNLYFVRELINSCQKMVKGKEYNLDSCPDLKVFSDIFKFPHRVECIKLVLRGFDTMIKDSNPPKL